MTRKEVFPVPIPVKTIRCDRFVMDYIVFGKGSRPLVILPGISLQPVTPGGDAIRASYCLFENTHTVYLFDRKRDIAAGYSVADMTEDTAEAMRMLGIRDADIFGASQGGMIAQLLAARYPGLVHRMVLASSAARMTPEADAVMRRWTALARAGDCRRLNRDLFAGIYSDAYRARYRDAFLALEHVGAPEDLARFAILTEACRTFDAGRELSRVTCPVLVMGARGDRTLFPESSAQLAEALGAALYLYDGYSHAVYDEAPDFTARAAAFLRGETDEKTIE